MQYYKNTVTYFVKPHQVKGGTGTEGGALPPHVNMCSVYSNPKKSIFDQRYQAMHFNKRKVINIFHD